MRRNILSAAVAATLLSAVALSAAAADTIRMAFIDPLSGPFAAVGSTGLKEMEFHADLINKKGGVLGKKSRSSVTTTRFHRKSRSFNSSG